MGARVFSPLPLFSFFFPYLFPRQVSSFPPMGSCAPTKLVEKVDFRSTTKLSLFFSPFLPFHTPFFSSFIRRGALAIRRDDSEDAGRKPIRAWRAPFFPLFFFFFFSLFFSFVVSLFFSLPSPPPPILARRKESQSRHGRTRFSPFPPFSFFPLFSFPFSLLSFWLKLMRRGGSDSIAKQCYGLRRDFPFSPLLFSPFPPLSLFFF